MRKPGNPAIGLLRALVVSWFLTRYRPLIHPSVKLLFSMNGLTESRRESSV